MNDTAPLIVTLTLDAVSFLFFNELRQRYFPPERNFLDTHLTLFHHLPGVERAAVETRLRACAANCAELVMRVTGVKMIGNGVAFELQSPELLALHRELQASWRDWLTPQDRQPLWPHVTVQNKVPAEAARALHRELSANFVPFEARGLGFTWWAYRGGPWERLGETRFALGN